jgi:hypothetical protein
MLNSMARSPFPRWVVGSSVALVVAVSTLSPLPAAAQESAALQGIVAEETTGRLIPSAAVSLVGSTLETRTGADGVFTFPQAPLGRVHVRVRAPGYPAVVEEVEVTAGLVFVPVFIPSSSAVLDELLVTGRRSDARPTPQARTAADLLMFQIPELGPAPTGARPRGNPQSQRLGLRGRGTFGGDGEPTIVLDGTLLRGGLEALRQIPAADVKSIRVLRGASAAFLYGSADGVIYVQTESGPPAP